MIEQKIDFKSRFLNSYYNFLSIYTCTLSKKIRLGQVKLESVQRKQKRSRISWKTFFNNFLEITS